jgi:dihydroxyacid dehydratase/phosphogluconate dehydratase
MAREKVGLTTRAVLTDSALRNAMTVHAAFGGSTNLLLHIPAIAHAAGLRRPTVDDWIAINRRTPRLVSVMPNGPTHHPTVRAFLAGGVPEVMLHLRDLGLLDLEALTATGDRLGETLDAWARSERRSVLRQRLQELDGVDPDSVILPPALARERGLTSTVTFPRGNLAPEGAVIKSTSIDPSVLSPEGVFFLEGPARVFTREREAITAIKAGHIRAGDVLVLAGVGPMGTGMEETYQLTSALKHLPCPSASTWRSSPTRASAVSRPAPASVMSVLKPWPAVLSAECAMAIVSASASIAEISKGHWIWSVMPRAFGNRVVPRLNCRLAPPTPHWPRTKNSPLTPGSGPHW